MSTKRNMAFQDCVDGATGDHLIISWTPKLCRILTDGYTELRSPVFAPFFFPFKVNHAGLKSGNTILSIYDG